MYRAVILIVIIALLGCMKDADRTYHSFVEYMQLDGPVKSISELTYINPKGMDLTGDTILHAKGILFDDLGNLSEIQWAGEKLSFHYLGDQLLRIQRRKRSNNRKIDAIELQYNGDGQLIERVVEMGSGSGRKELTSLDIVDPIKREDRVIVELQIQYPDFIFRTQAFNNNEWLKYEYDAQGNWVKEVLFNQGNPEQIDQIIVRQIEYIDSESSSQLSQVIERIKTGLESTDAGLYRDYHLENNYCQKVLYVNLIGLGHPDIQQYNLGRRLAKEHLKEIVAVYPRPDLFDQIGLAVYRDDSKGTTSAGYSSITFLFNPVELQKG